MKARTAKIKRHTLETQISLRLNLDGKGKAKIKTGIPFFDHMLTLFAKHATVDLELRCHGDLEVDAHHTVEDCGIALGQAVAAALGDKRGIRRYGHGFHPKNPFTGEAYVPMDECLARCVVDFSGRPFLVWRGLNQFGLKKISEAKILSGKVRGLLLSVGQNDERLALTKRYSQAMSAPVDLSASENDSELRGELMLAVNDLMRMLQRDFLK